MLQGRRNFLWDWEIVKHLGANAVPVRCSGKRESLCFLTGRLKSCAAKAASACLTFTDT